MQEQISRMQIYTAETTKALIERYKTREPDLPQVEPTSPIGSDILFGTARSEHSLAAEYKWFIIAGILVAVLMFCLVICFGEEERETQQTEFRLTPTTTRNHTTKVENPQCQQTKSCCVKVQEPKWACETMKYRLDEMDLRFHQLASMPIPKPRENMTRPLIEQHVKNSVIAIKNEQSHHERITVDDDRMPWEK